jgi:hypothetical protein
MKTILAIGATATCMLLAGCGGDSGSSVTNLDSNQIRPAGTTQVAPPGDGVKLGSNNSGGPGAAPPKKPAGE